MAASLQKMRLMTAGKLHHPGKGFGIRLSDLNNEIFKDFKQALSLIELSINKGWLRITV